MASLAILRGMMIPRLAMIVLIQLSLCRVEGGHGAGSRAGAKGLVGIAHPYASYDEGIIEILKTI